MGEEDKLPDNPITDMINDSDTDTSGEESTKEQPSDDEIMRQRGMNPESDESDESNDAEGATIDEDDVDDETTDDPDPDAKEEPDATARPARVKKAIEVLKRDRIKDSTIEKMSDEEILEQAESCKPQQDKVTEAFKAQAELAKLKEESQSQEEADAEPEPAKLSDEIVSGIKALEDEYGEGLSKPLEALFQQQETSFTDRFDRLE